MSVEEKNPRIEIKIASPERIRELSGGEVKNYKTYELIVSRKTNELTEKVKYSYLYNSDAKGNRVPVEGGLFDPKIFRNYRECPKIDSSANRIIFEEKFSEVCTNCENINICQSHECSGHIELAAPVVHIWYFDTIRKILGLKKIELKEILEYEKNFGDIDALTVQFSSEDLIKQLEKNKERYSKQYVNRIQFESGAELIRLLLSLFDDNYEAQREKIKTNNTQTKEIIQKRLDLIDSIHNSKNHFAWMVLDVIPIVPQSIRPEIMIDGLLCEDDLFYLYRSIISRNNRVKRLKNNHSPELVIRNECRFLQQAVDNLFDNAKCNGYQKKVIKSENASTEGRVYKSLTDKLSKKEGLFRQNLLGKRVDFSGRSVIVPGPELKLWQCGLPYEMALELFRPQILNMATVIILANIDRIIGGYSVGTFSSALGEFQTIEDDITSELEKSIEKAKKKNNKIIRISDINNKELISKIAQQIKKELLGRDFSDILFLLGLINRPIYYGRTHWIDFIYKTKEDSLKTKLKNGKKYSLKSIFSSLNKQINFLNEAIITDKLLQDSSYVEILSEFKKYEETKIDSISNINEKDFFEALLRDIINHNSLYCTCKLPQSKDEFQIFYMENHLNSILRNGLSRYKKYGFEEREKILFKDLLWRILLEFQSNLKNVTDYSGATDKLLKDSSFMRTLSNLKEIEEKAIECLSDISDEDFFKNLLKEIIVYDSLGKFCGLSDSKTVFEDYMENHLNSILRNCLSVYKKNKLEEQEETLFKDLLWNIIIELRFNFNLYSLVEIVVKDYPIILNRQPSLHRLNIQAFEPILVDEHAIKLHPLTCKSFGADFDGDQMAVHVPIGKEAIKECRELLLSSKNLFKPGDGKPIFTPSQDMVMGLYLLTAINPKWEKTKYTISNLNSPIQIHAPKKSICSNLLQSKDPEKERIYTEERTQDFKEGELITTTEGLILLNKNLPVNVDYINRQLDADTIKKLIEVVYKANGPEVSIELHDTLKRIGFKYATFFGTSISMNEIIISTEIKKVKEDIQKQIDELHSKKENKKITKYEYNKTIETIFVSNRDELEANMKKLLDSKRQAPGVYEMADSGARGKWNQVSQMVLMKGLVKNSRGDANLILSNFNEGLNPYEYFISTAGTRRDLYDGKFSTADAGYISRRLVYAAQDVVITEEDCGCSDTERSILTCKSKKGICQKCYGKDLASQKEVDIGTPVGIIAAQSLGEPTSQIVLDSKHKYGVAESNKVGNSYNRILARNIGKVEIFALENNDENKKVNNINVLFDSNNVLVFNDRYSSYCPKVKVGEEIYDIPYGYVLLVRNGDEILELNSVIAENSKTVETVKKIERLLENPKNNPDYAVVSDISGTVKEIGLTNKNSNKEFYDFVIEQEIEVAGKKNIISRPYSIPVTVEKNGKKEPNNLLVKDGEKVKNGQPLCEESSDSVVIAKFNGVVHIEYERYKKIIIIDEKGLRATGDYENFFSFANDEKHIKEHLIPDTEKICVEVGQLVKIYKTKLCNSEDKEYKAKISGIVDSIEDIEKIKSFSIVDSNGKKHIYDISELTMLKVKNGDKVKKGDLLCYPTSKDFPTKALLYVPKSDNNDKKEIHGTIKFITEKSVNWNVVIEDADKKKHKFSVPRTSQLCVKVKDKIQKGDKLSNGLLSLKDRFLTQNILAVQKDFVEELYNLIEDVDKKHIEVIVRQMFKDVQDDGTGIKGSIKGISKLGLNSDSFIVASAFQKTSKGLADAALTGKHEDFSGIIENQILGNLIPTGKGIIK